MDLDKQGKRPWQSALLKIMPKDSSKPFIILDEIHKYKEWKNYLKGIYDDCQNQYQFIVSGKGRLETFQKGADSTEQGKHSKKL